MKFKINWIAAAAGVAAGWFLLPQLLSAVGLTGLGQFVWNPNFRFWRPIGRYRIGQMSPGFLPGRDPNVTAWPATEPWNRRWFRSGTATMGQFSRAGQNLLPFGVFQRWPMA